MYKRGGTVEHPVGSGKDKSDSDTNSKRGTNCICPSTTGIEVPMRSPLLTNTEWVWMAVSERVR